MNLEIEVWRARLDLPVSRLAALRAHLSPSEREREARFARPGAGRRYAAARGQLREALGERLGMAAAAVPIVAGPAGKPRLDPAACLEDVRFNLSHSGERALITLAVGREVGVDIERHEARADLDRVASRFMSPAELARWRAEADGERTARFFAIWTRKEACAKGLGEGLGVGLSGLVLMPVAASPGWWRLEAPGSGGIEWWVADLDEGPGYSAALAVGGGRLAVRVLDLPAD